MVAAAKKSNPGRRAMRDALASGTRVVIPGRPCVRHAAARVEFKVPERAKETCELDGRQVSIESQRDYAWRCEEAREAWARARRAARAKGSTCGPNAWRADTRTVTPYPPTDALSQELADVRRHQRIVRKRVRQGRVVHVTLGAATFSVTGVGMRPSGKTLEARRAEYIARRELRKLARRVKRHGGPFSKASRRVVARVQAEQAAAQVGGVK